MKIIKKCTLFLLVITIILMSFVSCSDKKIDKNKETKKQETSYYIVQNNESEYKIVINEDEPYNIMYVVNEFNQIFQKACGIKLEIEKDSEYNYSDNSKIISIGNTSIAKQLNICPNLASYDQQEFLIKTQDKSVFLIGGGERGIYYAVYEFLSQEVGFDQVAADELYVNECTEVPLYNFNYTDKPDIRWRVPTYGSINTDSIASNRMRFTRSTIICPYGSTSIHNSFSAYFPLTEYYNSHPTWYSTTYDSAGNKIYENGYPFQLCYTSGGNQNDLATMRNIVLDKLKQYVSESYDKGDCLESISFTMQDNTQWCACESCKALKQQYGTNAASVIKFINPVAKEFKQWLNETYPGAIVNITIFAYLASKEAPVKKVNGKYEPIDETVRPEENVAVMYAPIFADFLNDFYSKENSTYYEEIMAWASITKYMYFWFYSTNFGNYFSWFDTFNSMQANYKFIKGLGAFYFFDQGRHNAKAVTAFDSLKVYLSSKLEWDVNADVVSLTNSYFDKYFKNASEPMKEYYYSFRTWMQYLRKNVGLSSDVGNDFYTTQHFPKQVLLNWMSYIYKAYEAIEIYKGDTELYNSLYNRINKESMAIRFYLIDFYSKSYSADEEYDLKKSFKDDAIKYGFDNISELVSVSTVWKKWNI